MLNTVPVKNLLNIVETQTGATKIDANIMIARGNLTLCTDITYIRIEI